MENQIATIDQKSLMFEPANLTKETVKRFICPDATEQEMAYFLQTCRTFNLNPLKREIYFVKYGDMKANILVGYEVYLKRAERSQKWGGMEVITEGSIKEGNLKAIVKIYRKDWTNPLVHEADYSEYVQKKKDGTPNTFWANKPKTMIKKVAISQAFRFAFPDEFDGMPYTSDEVIDQEKVIDIADVEQKQNDEQKKIDAMRRAIMDIKIAIGDLAWAEVLTWHKVEDVMLLEDLALGSKIYSDMKAQLGKKNGKV